MHIVMISLTVAFGVCVLLLPAFAGFTRTPYARRIAQDERWRIHRPKDA